MYRIGYRLVHNVTCITYFIVYIVDQVVSQRYGVKDIDIMVLMPSRNL